jgi:hypothetical protein
MTQMVDQNGNYGLFYMVVLETPNELVLWQSTTSDISTTAWVTTGEIITRSAISPGSIMQSHFYVSTTAPGDFEVLVTETGQNMVHYTRNNTISIPGQSAWSRSKWIVDNVTPGTISPMIQSTFGAVQGHGNFETVVLQGQSLVHYVKINSPGKNNKWLKTAVISNNALSGGAFIEDSRNFFIVVVPEADTDGNYTLVQYYRNNNVSNQGWGAGTDIATGSGQVGLAEVVTSSTTDEIAYEMVYVSHGDLKYRSGLASDKTVLPIWSRPGTLVKGGQALVPQSLIQTRSSTGTPGDLGLATVQSTSMDLYSANMASWPTTTAWSSPETVTAPVWG